RTGQGHDQARAQRVRRQRRRCRGRALPRPGRSGFRRDAAMDPGGQPAYAVDPRTAVPAGADVMALIELAELLKRHIGLDAASIGASAIESAVRARTAACGLQDATAYLAHLSDSEEELQELIEAIVVPETWFFRDPDVFAALVRLIRNEWL